MDELLFYKAMLYYKDQALQHALKIHTRGSDDRILFNAKEKVLCESAIDQVNTIGAALHYLKVYENTIHK